MMNLANLILIAICCATLTFMAVVFIHHSSSEDVHNNHRDAKSIAHPLLEQYNLLSESVAEKSEQLRESYMSALQKQKLKLKLPERDGLDAKVRSLLSHAI